MSNEIYGSVIENHYINMSKRMSDILEVVDDYDHGITMRLLKIDCGGRLHIDDAEVHQSMKSLQMAGMVYVKMIKPPKYYPTRYGKDVLQVKPFIEATFGEVQNAIKKRKLEDGRTSKPKKSKKTLPPPPPRKRKKGEPKHVKGERNAADTGTYTGEFQEGENGGWIVTDDNDKTDWVERES